MQSQQSRRGLGLVEVTISTMIMSVVILAIFGLLRRDTQLSRATLGIGLAEMKAQEMLRKLETELADAHGESPVATLDQPLGSGETTSLYLDSLKGFPDRGAVLINRGNINEERIRYQRTWPGSKKLQLLSRGQQCTSSNSHNAGSTVLWLGMAETLPSTPMPPAWAFDGIALEPTGTTPFRGDGAGFSYRIPVDPTGSTPPNYLDNNGAVRWGAEFQGTGSVDGRSILYFSPDFLISETVTQDDINGDGDVEDTFDVGQIRRRTWSVNGNGTQPIDIGLGPRSILQERCNWGGDLDADGFDDPIFLWNEDGRWLHIRLFILGRSVQEIPIVRKVDSMVFLRNVPEN